MAIRQEEAFVLKRTAIRETSLLAALFTRGMGKVRVLAKGVRKEKSALLSAFEPFTRVNVIFYEKLKSDTHLVSDISILDSNLLLRSRLDRLSFASYLCELIDALFDFHGAHPALFDLLKQAFEWFQKVKPSAVVRVFEVKALKELGWLPILDRCAVCGNTGFNRVFFSAKQGGLLCPKCDLKERGSIPISNEAVQSLAFFVQSDFDSAVQLKLNLTTWRELERALYQFIQFRLEHPLRTPRFLSQVRPVLL